MTHHDFDEKIICTSPASIGTDTKSTARRPGKLYGLWMGIPIGPTKWWRLAIGITRRTIYRFSILKSKGIDSINWRSGAFWSSNASIIVRCTNIFIKCSKWTDLVIKCTTCTNINDWIEHLNIDAKSATGTATGKQVWAFRVFFLIFFPLKILWKIMKYSQFIQMRMKKLKTKRKKKQKDPNNWIKFEICVNWNVRRKKKVSHSLFVYLSFSFHKKLSRLAEFNRLRMSIKHGTRLIQMFPLFPTWVICLH